MTVAELVERLSKFPPDHQVRTEDGTPIVDVVGQDKFNTDEAVWLIPKYTVVFDD